jgi:type IV secretion system protein VirD4
MIRMSMLVVIAIVILVVLVYRRRGWKPAGTAFGVATWLSETAMQAAGMLGKSGLVLARTAAGKLIRLPRYTHLLLVGATGAGKGVSIIIPILLSYFRSSLVAFDPKGDLYSTTAARRRGRQRIIRLAPFNGGNATFNPLDTIPADSPLLIDHARAMAESLVVRTGMEHDSHWNDKGAQTITALLVFLLLRAKGDERSLSSVQDIASDPMMLLAVADRLENIGGIPARLGSQLRALFEPARRVVQDGEEKQDSGPLTKEGSGVLSTVTRHLAFLDSDMVKKSVAKSNFDVRCLLRPGVTLYLQIPPDQLEAQKGLLRCWVSTLIRVIGMSGNENKSEVLFLLDEASALGSLAAIEEALVRGRSAGVRLLLAYQSDSQVQTAFKDKPALLYDNCSTQIYLCPPSSYETAERISKMLGDYTQVVDNYGTNAGSSRGSSSSYGGTNSSTQFSSNSGSSLNYQQQGRALLRPEEVLTLNDKYLIAFQRGLRAPLLARRILWYADADFSPNAARQFSPDVSRTVQRLLLCAGIIALIAIIAYGLNL